MTVWLIACRAWQRVQFGRTNVTIGPQRHLRDEVDEVLRAKRSKKPEECVDVVFLAWQVAHRCGCGPLRFVWLMWKKLYVNAFVREWPKRPDPFKPIEHVRSDAKEA